MCNTCKSVWLDLVTLSNEVSAQVQYTPRMFLSDTLAPVLCDNEM